MGQKGGSRMYGYELEIQRQRVDRLKNEAAAHRLIGRKAQIAFTSTLRRAVGESLVKLGLRLQGDVAQSVPTLAAA